MTYKEAKQKANKQNPNVVFAGDAGDGHRWEVYYCPRRKKQIWTTVLNNGYRVI